MPVAEPEARQDRHPHRAPTERSPAPSEHTHRRRPRLSLAGADGRDADDDKNGGATDPHGRGQEVDDAEKRDHDERLDGDFAGWTSPRECPMIPGGRVPPQGERRALLLTADRGLPF